LCYLRCMTFNVIERDANFLGVLIDGAAIGPFESERTAREWLKGFGFTSNVEVAVHRERVEGRGNMLERRVRLCWLTQCGAGFNHECRASQPGF
jgi:hypothetical protein